MSLASYLIFCGLCVALSLTPGPDTFLILRFSIRRAAAGITAGAGSALAALVWAALVGAGLAALLEQSAIAYRVVKILGGLYLLYLGIQAWRQSRAAGAEQAPATLPGKRSLVSSFGAGALSTLTNPKVGLFFVAVVPQFLPHGAGVFAWTMLLGATEAVIAFGYLTAVALVAAKANAWLKRPRVTAVLERISAAVLAALGIGTLASAAIEP
ncbi:MAG: LysE family translocator [Microbacteriaceae bacterium]